MVMAATTGLLHRVTEQIHLCDHHGGKEVAMCGIAGAIDPGAERAVADAWPEAWAGAPA